MNRTFAVVAATLTLAAASFAPAAALPSIHIASPALAFFSHPTGVRFNLRNGSATPVDLKAGDSSMTIAPGKTLQVDLPVGTRITLAAALGTRPAGDLITEVSGALKGTTIVLH